MLKKLMIMGIVYVFFIQHAMRAVIIFTYKYPDDILQYRVDYSAGSNRVDEIRDADDDFVRQGSFATNVGPATGNLINDNLSYPSYNQDYLDFYYTTLDQPSLQTDMRLGNFNLYSGDALQLSNLVNDFDMNFDLFKPDPQLVTIIEYYLNNTIRITPGQRFAFPDNVCTVSILRKDNLGYGGFYNRYTKSVYHVTCPPSLRVEIDVSEIMKLPVNNVTTSFKGCIITNQTLITPIG